MVLVDPVLASLCLALWCPLSIDYLSIYFLRAQPFIPNKLHVLS